MLVHLIFFFVWKCALQVVQARLSFKLVSKWEAFGQRKSTEMSELYCCLGCPAFEPGRQNLIFLYCNPDVIFEPEEWVVSVEFHGHLVGSTRWIKDVRHFENWLTYERVPEMILDQGHKLPIDPSLKEKNGPEFRRQCIFSTAKIVVSPISVQETGLVVEVDVPKEMLPTFRGRAVQVNYYLTVTMEKSDVQKRLHFPVPMNGLGYDKPTVLVQSGGIVAYAPTTIPEETYLESSFLEVTSDERETEGSLHGSHHSSHSSHVKSPVSEKSINIHPPVVYSVRDESHICNVSLPRGGLIAGDHEAFEVSFSDQAQPCYAIKASMRMIESQFRADDTTPITVQVRYPLPLLFACSLSIIDVYMAHTGERSMG